MVLLFGRELCHGNIQRIFIWCRYCYLYWEVNFYVLSFLEKNTLKKTVSDSSRLFQCFKSKRIILFVTLKDNTTITEHRVWSVYMDMS